MELVQRFDFNAAKPDFCEFDFDGDFAAGEWDELAGVLRIGLLEAGGDVDGAAVDDVGGLVSLPDDFDGVPLVEQLEVAILDEPAAGGDGS